MGDLSVCMAYTGMRLTSKGSIAHFWKVDSEAHARGYKGRNIAPGVIGEYWTFTCDKDGNVYTGGSAKRAVRTKLFVDDVDKRAEWIALDASHREAYAQLKTQRKLANRKTEFETAMEPLRRMVASMRTHTDKAALINHITNELWRR